MMSAARSGAVDRAALVLQLVPYLISKDEISLAEAAADFDVSEAQMRTMVESLTVLGLPGDDEYQGMDHELFGIDWDLLDEHDMIRITNSVALERVPRLTAAEASALLAGLQLARVIPGVGGTEIFDGLLQKLARGSASTPADVVVVPGPVAAARDTVAAALARGKAVSFTYQAPDAPRTTRTVDPIKVLIANGQWYLQGWCHLRAAARTFHLDRVRDILITDIDIMDGAVPDLPATSEANASDASTNASRAGTGSESRDVAFSSVAQPEPQSGLLVRVSFPASAATVLGAYLDDVRVRTSAGISRADIRVADEFSLRRLVARAGGMVRIEQPEAARHAAAAWSQAGIDQYGIPLSAPDAG